MGYRLPSPRRAVDLVELPCPASPRVDGTTVRLHRRRGWIAGTVTVREIWRHLRQQTISTRPRRPGEGTRPGLTFREHIADPTAPLQEGVVPLFVGQGSVAEVLRDSGEGRQGRSVAGNDDGRRTIWRGGPLGPWLLGRVATVWMRRRRWTRWCWLPKFKETFGCRARECRSGIGGSSFGVSLRKCEAGAAALAGLLMGERGGSRCGQLEPLCLGEH